MGYGHVSVRVRIRTRWALWSEKVLGQEEAIVGAGETYKGLNMGAS